MSSPLSAKRYGHALNSASDSQTSFAVGGSHLNVHQPAEASPEYNRATQVQKARAEKYA